MSTKRLSLLFIIILVLLSSSSCNRQKGVDSTLQSIDQHSVLNSIPSDSGMFFIWDTQAKSYQEFLKSAWSDSNLNLIKDLTAQQPNLNLSNILDLQNNLKEALHKHVQVIAGYVPTKHTQPALGLIIRAKSAQDRTSFLSNVEAELAKQGMKISTISSDSTQKQIIDDKSNFKLNYDNIGEQDILVGTDIEILKSANSPETKTTDSIRTKPEYKKLIQELGKRQNEYLFAYADISKLVETGSAFHDALPISAEELPLSTVSISHAMNEGPSTEVVALANSNTSSGKTMLESLSSIGNLDAVKSVPASAFFSVALNGKLLSVWLDEIIKQAGQYTADANSVNLDKFKSVKTIVLGAEKAEAGSMFPGLIVLLESERCNEIYTDLKSTIDIAIKDQVGSSLAWQTKTIGGNNAEYIMSPFGVGAYLAKDKNNCWLTSSETALSSALSGDAKNLGSLWSDSIKDRVSSDGAIFSVHLQFKELAKVAQELSGSLAMFTGGESPIQPKQLEMIEKLGQLSANLNASGDIIKFTTGYTKEPVS